MRFRVKATGYEFPGTIAPGELGIVEKTLDEQTVRIWPREEVELVPLPPAVNRQWERVPFRLIKMPCCEHLLCWVNPRFPNYCPECGKWVMDRVRGSVLVTDEDAELRRRVG